MTSFFTYCKQEPFKPAILCIISNIPMLLNLSWGSSSIHVNNQITKENPKISRKVFFFFLVLFCFVLGFVVVVVLCFFLFCFVIHGTQIWRRWIHLSVHTNTQNKESTEKNNREKFCWMQETLDYRTRNIFRYRANNILNKIKICKFY